MSVVSAFDENIDYDSSFEVVEDEQLKSESFQFVITKGGETNTINIESAEDSAPILTSIIGKWKPISSDNLEDYFKRNNMTELNELAWQHGIVCYELKGGLLHVHTELLNKKLSASVFKLNDTVNSGHNSVVSLVENNSLNTVCTHPSEDGKELWKVERFIKNGKLVIINQHGGFKCERTYQRV
ncbi:hypothetical protein L5515_014750 [Caenorhabditis briggsae]|uniref:Uncharacterized protein n=1 Tax=Caenorhabditis briggsae TaxID=6238 RepID=A0AAE9E9Z4_CAEBR|nr:hypothetical protein L5515_014750 [Caenorhabditis briggsae]